MVTGEPLQLPTQMSRRRAVLLPHQSALVQYSMKRSVAPRNSYFGILKRKPCYRQLSWNLDGASPLSLCPSNQMEADPSLRGHPVPKAASVKSEAYRAREAEPDWPFRLECWRGNRVDVNRERSAPGRVLEAARTAVDRELAFLHN